MNKTQTWTAVKEILEKSKASKKLMGEMEALLAPKSSGGHSKHPPITDEEGNTLYWCRYHESYEPETNMVLSKDGKSKGYCRAAAAISNKRRKEARAMKLQAIEIMGENPKKASDLVEKAKEVESQINDAAFYDLEKDWEAFNKE